MNALDFFDRTPPQVILWGASNYLHEYLPCLEEAGVQVLFAVDACGKGMPRVKIPVKTLKKFRSELSQYADVPIVALENRTGAYATDPWSSTCHDVTVKLGAPNRLLNPVFLCDRVKLNFRGRVVSGGFPGSGNAVVQAIVDRLMQFQPRSWSGKEHLMGFLAGQHLAQLQKQISTAVQNAGSIMGYCTATPQTSDAAVLHASTKEDNQIMLCDVPSRTHLHSDMHRTHQVLDVQSVEYFRNLGFEVFASVRHPLDILISVARKLAAEPQPMLTDLDWFRDVARSLFRYLRLLEDSRQNLHVVRYEDLIARPVEAIRNIAAVIDIACPEERAQEIWDAVGFKSLNLNPQHLWKPGAGKWRKYLNENHLAIVRELEVVDILAALGYDTNLDLGPAALPDDSDLKGQDKKFTSITDGFYGVMFDMPRHILHPEVTSGTSVDLQCRYICSNAATLQALSSLEQSSSMRNLVNSLPRLFTPCGGEVQKQKQWT
jgi:hypothetical protein